MQRTCDALRYFLHNPWYASLLILCSSYSHERGFKWLMMFKDAKLRSETWKVLDQPYSKFDVTSKEGKEYVIAEWGRSQGSNFMAFHSQIILIHELIPILFALPLRHAKHYNSFALDVVSNTSDISAKNSLATSDRWSITSRDGIAENLLQSIDYVGSWKTLQIGFQWVKQIIIKVHWLGLV